MRASPQTPAFWDEYYEKVTLNASSEPCYGLKLLWPHLRLGKVLDVAMGDGSNLVFLAQKGFAAEGIDFSPKAIEKCQARAETAKVSVSARVQNLDFFLMPLMKYDSVIMTYYKPQARILHTTLGSSVLVF